MTATTETSLTDKDLSLTNSAHTKIRELFDQVEDGIEGVRVFATPGGCSGLSFGMTFTDKVDANDGVLQCDGFKVIVDNATIEYLRGVEIDFVDRGEGNASFVFNNIQPVGSGCGTCGSAGGCS